MECTDYEGWMDKDGEGCVAHDGRCGFDAVYWANADGIDANSACCKCGGGIRKGV